MRFIIGILLGFGIGFAGAVLFAPEKKPEPEFIPGQPQNTNGNGGLLDKARERVKEAVSEAKEAREQAEREMRDRYERTVKNPSKN
ncbi:MAG: YtxH domain-containing protein [Chloroflexota bacterium]